MGTAFELLSTALADRKIDERDVAAIREHLYRDGRLDLEDVKLLTELYCEAKESCPAFEDLFFDTLEHVLLADGEIQPAEQFYLLKMLYSDREIRQRERQLLLTLKRQQKRPAPEFEALCQEALQAHPTNWDVGGH